VPRDILPLLLSRVAHCCKHPIPPQPLADTSCSGSSKSGRWRQFQEPTRDGVRASPTARSPIWPESWHTAIRQLTTLTALTVGCIVHVIGTSEHRTIVEQFEHEMVKNCNRLVET